MARTRPAVTRSRAIWLSSGPRCRRDLFFQGDAHREVAWCLQCGAGLTERERNEWPGPRIGLAWQSRPDCRTPAPRPGCATE